MYFITVHIHFKTQKTVLHFMLYLKKNKTNKNNKPHALMLLVDTVTGTLFFLSLLISQPLSLNCSQSVLVSLQDQALQPTHSQLFMCYLFIFFLQTYLHLHKSTGLTWTSSNLYRQVFGLIFCFFGGLWFAASFVYFLLHQ